MINRPKDWVHGLYRHVTNVQGHKMFDLLNKLPDFGVGMKLKKITWAQDRYLEVVRVLPKRDGKHGVVIVKHFLDGEFQYFQRVKSPYKAIWLYAEKPKIPRWKVEPSNWQEEILNIITDNKELEKLAEDNDQGDKPLPEGQEKRQENEMK